jgi:nucleoside-diphosphate-sugar epimerase
MWWQPITITQKKNLMVTVLGSSGFIGSNILNKLASDNIPFYAPAKTDDLGNRDLGDVIYCIGLTADFRTKPFETVTAHVCKLNEVLAKCKFSSLTYLSSTRVYINSTSDFASETDKLVIDPLNPEDLYTLTKLTGERLCLSSGKNTKIARLSNVFGKHDTSTNFLFQIIDEIQKKGKVELHQTLSSAKDYILIDDVADLLINIALKGKEKIYNLASGFNTTNAEIIENLHSHFSFSSAINAMAKEVVFPVILNDKICNEFNYKPKKIAEQFSSMI